VHPGANSIELYSKSALQDLPMAKAVVGLAATHSRGLGGEVAAGFIAGAISQSAQDYQEAKRNLAAEREKLDGARQELSDSQRQAAVLRERVAGMSRSKHLGNLLILVGTSLISIGLGGDPFHSQLNAQTLGLCIVGALLILVAWFAPVQRGDK
jgi:hypothetical protein